MRDKLGRILFFDLEVTGHHIEYLYHLIKFRVEHPEYPEFILLIHPNAITSLNNLCEPEFLESKGVSIIHPTPKEINYLSKASHTFKKAKVEFDIFAKYVKEKNVDKCYLMSLNKFQYVLGTRKAKKIESDIGGILFNPIGPVRGNKLSLLTKLRKYLQIKWMLHNPKIKNIFILNDDKLASSLNLQYKTPNFFISLPDPILIPPKISSENLLVNIPECSRNKIRFLLFGSLSHRKGIFLLLEALKILPKNVAPFTEFYFAGKILNSERSIFLDSLSQIKNQRKDIFIRYLDDFIPYKSIANLFNTSDCILVPYVGNHASSGVIGHAALYEKPVIGPKSGLIGAIIDEYSLGITIDGLNAEKLSNTIAKFVQKRELNRDTQGMKLFVERRHPDMFVKKLINI